MIYFSYEKIYLLARGDPSKIMFLFKKLISKDKELFPYLTGNNWIVNPIVFSFTRNSDVKCAEFLGLLSFRHLAEYKLYGKTELSVHDLPSWVSINTLEPSSLWELRGDKIFFPTESNQIIL